MVKKTSGIQNHIDATILVRRVFLAVVFIILFQVDAQLSAANLRRVTFHPYITSSSLFLLLNKCSTCFSTATFSRVSNITNAAYSKNFYIYFHFSNTYFSHTDVQRTLFTCSLVQLLIHDSYGKFTTISTQNKNYFTSKEVIQKFAATEPLR